MFVIFSVMTFSTFTDCVVDPTETFSSCLNDYKMYSAFIKINNKDTHTHVCIHTHSLTTYKRSWKQHPYC